MDSQGRLLGTEAFPATTAGYAELAAWLESFGGVGRVGIEGTGPYGAGLTRHLHSSVRDCLPSQLSASATDNLRVTQPRMRLPGATYFVTHTVHERRFLLTPSPEVNRIIRYAAARAADLLNVELPPR